MASRPVYKQLPKFLWVRNDECVTAIVYLISVKRRMVQPGEDANQIDLTDFCHLRLP
jgi:hypothetical protein